MVSGEGDSSVHQEARKSVGAQPTGQGREVEVVLSASETEDDDDDDFQDVLSEGEYLQTQLKEEQQTAVDSTTAAATTPQPSVSEDKQVQGEYPVQESPSSAESTSLRRRSNDNNKILDISSQPGDDVVQFDFSPSGSYREQGRIRLNRW